MKAFALSCLAAVVIAIAAHLVLNRALPLSSEQAYSPGSHLRIGPD